MPLSRDRRLAAFAVTTLLSVGALAQDWPRQKPITFLVAFGAGSSTDISSTSMPPAMPQIKAGRVRVLAVTSAQRPALSRAARCANHE